MLSRSHTRWSLVSAVAIALAAAPGAAAQAPATGGTPYTAPAPAPTAAAVVAGRAVVPASAPLRVRHVITAANRLVLKPYRWGGGHRAFATRLESAYDCSGAVSYALYGGRFLAAPLDSSGLATWGRKGPGQWITVYANKGHAYVVVAGLRFDTAMRDPTPQTAGTGPRWSAVARSGAGFVARHPAGF
jgi:hypothetical protein